MNQMLSLEISSKTRLPTRYGVFDLYAFNIGDQTHLALVQGELQNQKDVLVRVHSECLTGDVFGSQRCDCGTQLESALQLICEKKEGVVIYLRGHEGRGIGLEEKLKAYALQDRGLDTVEANLALGHPVDLRDFTAAAKILQFFEVYSVALMSNNPCKYEALASCGIKVSQKIPLVIRCQENQKYLDVKKEKLGHLFL